MRSAGSPWEPIRWRSGWPRSPRLAAATCAASASGKEAKDHGVTGRLAGALLPSDRVVVVEDTTTRGTSLLNAVEVVRAFGAEVVFASVIVDRGTTCGDLCAAAGVPYRPLLTARDLGFEPGT